MSTAVFGICLYSISAMTHIFGLYSIYLTRDSIFPSVQWIYIINMSTCELVYSIVLIVTYSLAFRFPEVSAYVEGFAYTALAYWLFASNLLIMVDRFMEVYLNIHYNLFWSEKKAKQVVVMSTVLFSMIGVLFAIFLRGNNNTLIYVWIFLDQLHVLVAFVSYGYLYTKLRAGRRRINKISEQVSSNYQSAAEGGETVGGEKEGAHSMKFYMERMKKNFYLPTLFILNFAFFTYLPDLLTIIYTLDENRDYNDISMVTYVMYVLGFLFDALIYVFAPKKIRSTLKKKFLCSSQSNVEPWG